MKMYNRKYTYDMGDIQGLLIRPFEALHNQARRNQFSAWAQRLYRITPTIYLRYEHCSHLFTGVRGGMELAATLNKLCKLDHKQRMIDANISTA